jgi:hypothetical protein
LGLGLREDYNICVTTVPVVTIAPQAPAPPPAAKHSLISQEAIVEAEAIVEVIEEVAMPVHAHAATGPFRHGGRTCAQYRNGDEHNKSFALHGSPPRSPTLRDS